MIPNAECFTQTVPVLRQIDPIRRNWLRDDPEQRSLADLNAAIPEINEIELDNTLSEATAGPILRVAAWNLERGRHWREAAQLWQEQPSLQRIDVLCLSEMDYGMARSGNYNTTRELARALGMNYAYGVEFLELSGGTPEEQHLYPTADALAYHGNAILSRLPLRNVRLLRFSGIEKWYGSGEQRLGGRIGLLAEVAVSDRWITIASLHLESGRDDSNDITRLQQGQLLLQALAPLGSDAPIILGGDFNAVATAPVMQQFRAAGFTLDSSNDLSNSTYQVWVDGRIEFGYNHIDYILTRGLKVVPSSASPAVILAAYPWEPTGKMLSDHAIVTVAIRLDQFS